MVRVLTRVFVEVLLFAAISLIFAHYAFAQVVINEVMPAPSQGNEWVELKNAGSDLVELTGWTVEDANGVLQPNPSLSGVVMQPGAFFVFELVNKLNNTGDTVTLKDVDAQVVDQFNYASSGSALSWSRVSSTQSAFVQPTPSRGVENTLPSPSPTPSPSAVPTPSPSPSLLPSPSVLPSTSPTIPSPQPVHLPSPVPLPSPSIPPTIDPVHLSEVLACPETSAKEWVEFYNPNAQPLTLQGWKLKDDSGNARTLELALPARGYSLFELSTGIFNNHGDTLFILNSQGYEMIRVELPSCTRGESTIYTTGGWQQTQEPTPLQANVLRTQGTEETELDIELQAGSAALATPSLSFRDELFAMPPELMGSSFSNEGLFILQEEITPDETSPASIYTLPQLVASSPKPVPEDNSGAPDQDDAGPTERQIPSKAWVVSLFTLSIGLIGISGYGLYQWYTERYVKDSLEAF